MSTPQTPEVGACECGGAGHSSNPMLELESSVNKAITLLLLLSGELARDCDGRDGIWKAGAMGYVDLAIELSEHLRSQYYEAHKEWSAGK